MSDEIEKAIIFANDIVEYIEKLSSEDETVGTSRRFIYILTNIQHIKDALMKHSLKRDIAIKSHMSRINNNLDRIYTRLGSQEHKITALNDKVYSMENAIESALEDLKYSIEDIDEDD